MVGKKITGLDLSDDEGKMNLDLSGINGELLVVSQFTLHASTKKGTRPSYIKAANPEKAIPLTMNLKECQISQDQKLKPVNLVLRWKLN